MNLTDNFIHSLYNLNFSEFPESVIHQAKRCLLDYLGATLAGAKMLENKSISVLEDLGHEKDGINVIGLNRKTNPYHAAFVNGLSAHIAELDDGVISGIVHPGSPVFSALLPVSEKESIDGKSFLKAVILAYEATVKIAESIQPAHKKRGYHATATCGTIGVAVGIAAMLGFNREQMKDTFSAAVVSAFGTLKVLEDDSELKPFNVARAANAGLLAALMAKSGFNGPVDVLSGNAGFLSMVTDTYDLNKLNSVGNNSFGIEKVFFKPYAACRYCHPTIEAAINLRNENHINVEEITSVHINTYKWAVVNHDHTEIPGESSAKMSIPYSFAVATLSGKADIEEFSNPKIKDPAISSLTKKVKVFSNDEFTEIFPDKSIAVVEIKTSDGRSYQNRVDFPKGEPENPLTDDELEEKFRSLARFAGKSETEINKIIDIVWNIESRLNSLYRFL